MAKPRLHGAGSWLMVCLLVLPAVVAVAQQGSPVTLTVDDVLKDFDAGWQIISDTFVDPKTYGVDWKALKDEYRPKVKAAPDAKVAYELFAEMVGKLESPTTGVVSPWERAAAAEAAAAAADPLLQYGGVGILLQPLESGDISVASVFRGTPAEQAGVLIGDIITGVDAWRVGGETAMEQVTQRVRGQVGTKVALTLRDPEGKERSVTMTRASIDLRPSIEQRIVSGSIGYLRIPQLTKELVDATAKSLPNLLSTNGLILDLRSMGGGSLEQMVVVAQWFLGAAHMGGFVARQGAEALPYRSEAMAAYQRPMVVLTNSATYGIAEILAFLLRQYKRAGLVGEATAGGFEVANEVPLPSGGLLEVAVARFTTGQGTLLPLGGLKPDVAVDPPDLATLRAGRDVVIERAVETLRSNPRW